MIDPLPPVVAFDGDDTLWHNETLFSMTHDRFAALITAHVTVPREVLDAHLLAVERRNLALYGYGVKSFVLSLIETAIEITEARIPASDIAKLLAFGRDMLAHPTHLLDGVASTLEALRARGHRLWLITKGDLFDQEGKVARSGLADLFERIEIVSEKDAAMYRDLLRRADVPPESFCMVGNTLRSDVLPVLAIGARAVHVPYHVTWALEVVAAPDGVHSIERLSDLLEPVAA